MKKNVIKTIFAAVCVVAAGMGGMKAYNAENKSEENLLLSENVEALSFDETSSKNECDYCRSYRCQININGNVKIYDNQRKKWTIGCDFC